MLVPEKWRWTLPIAWFVGVVAFMLALKAILM